MYHIIFYIGFKKKNKFFMFKYDAHKLPYSRKTNSVSNFEEINFFYIKFWKNNFLHLS